MEEILAEITRLAKDLERSVRELIVEANESSDSRDRTQLDDLRLQRIEETINSIHAHTSVLIARLPEDVTRTLAGPRRGILEHGAQILSRQGGTAVAYANQSALNPTELVERLSPQEKRVFKLCFHSGPLTYKQLGNKLGISPISAKNLVNRIFHENGKRTLFRKEALGGTVKVAVSHNVERQILKGRANHGEDDEDELENTS